MTSGFTAVCCTSSSGGCCDTSSCSSGVVVVVECSSSLVWGGVELSLVVEVVHDEWFHGCLLH